MKRTVIFEPGSLLGAASRHAPQLKCSLAAGELELLTFTNRSSDCASCSDGVFCSLLRIPSEVRSAQLLATRVQRSLQVYWESVADFARQPLTIKSEFLKQLPMFSSLSNDTLLFTSCIVQCVVLCDTPCFNSRVLQTLPVSQRSRNHSIRKRGVNFKPSGTVCDERVCQHESSSCPIRKGHRNHCQS